MVRSMKWRAEIAGVVVGVLLIVMIYWAMVEEMRLR